jgi:undecaprenyl-diphosphatase
VTVRSRLADRFDGFADSIHELDERATQAISDAPFLRRIPRVFVAATYLGDGYIWLGLALGLLAFGGQSGRWNVLAGFLITVANLILVRLLKYLFSRERPEDAVEEMRGRLKDAYSFPSGHATTSFGLAWLVAASYPNPAIQAVVYIAASVIALSRVVLREHYLSDVVAGATLGTFVAVCILRVFR